MRISELLEYSSKYDDLVKDIPLIQPESRELPKTIIQKPKYIKRIFQRKHSQWTDFKDTYDKEQRFTRNRKLRDQDAEFEYSEELILEFFKCRHDVVYFAQNYVSIFNGRYEYAIKFEPRPYQVQLLRSLQDNRFNVANQSRQTGKSITVAVFIVWLITFHANRHCGIINKVKDDSGKNLRDVVKILEGLPDFLSCGVISLSTSGIELENGSLVNTHASKVDTVNGYTYSLTWLDEFALQKEGGELLESGVIPLTSANATSRVIITSTPRGKNHFHKVCSQAIKYADIKNEDKGDPDYKKWILHEVLWYENPDNGYQKTFKLSLTEPYYYKLIPTYKNAFAKDTIEKIGIEKFKQDYEINFLSGDNHFIPLEFVEDYKQLILSKGVGQYEECYGGVRLYSYARKDIRYVISVDPSNGGGGDVDAFAISVWGYDNGKYAQVASFAKPNVSVKDAADILGNLCEDYFDPIVIVETNGSGAAFIQECKSSERDITLYKSKNGFGVTTTSKNRVPSLGLFRDAFMRGDVGIIDLDFLAELEHFTSKDDKRTKFEADTGKHDDRIMTACILFNAASNGDLHKQMGVYDV
ncbi:hypothetical protein [Vibrio harveyi]|uniref:hypothetical protein n=1 Tax=Vibrio harveyi TaxID=669 RepID=UPI003CEC6AA1